MIDGVDVSICQGIIDWPTVRRAGFRFAFIKASEGSYYKDPKFKLNLDGAVGAGIYVGAYHFARCNSDPIKQMELFWAACGGLGNGEGELPPVIDLESRQGLTSEQIVEWLRVASETLACLSGRPPILYTGPSFWRELDGAGKAADWVTNLTLWLAQYSVDAPWYPKPEQHPSVPAPFVHWTFWQYSGDHGLPVPGVHGACDRNVFNGTQEQLDELVNVAEPTIFPVCDEASV